MGGASSTVEERKTGSASNSGEAQSHGAAGRIPLRKLWEYVNWSKNMSSSTRSAVKKMYPVCKKCHDNIEGYGKCKKGFDNFFKRKSKINGCPKVNQKEGKYVLR